MSVRLVRKDVAVLVVDIQDRLCAAMNEEKLERLVNRTCALIQGARTLELPIVCTEQYPRGIGPTLEPVRACLEGVPVFEKLRFSSVLPEVLSAFHGRKHILLAGMETHVCIFQTVRDLQEQGYVPWVCRDAVISRNDEDRLAGLDMIKAAGAYVTSVESALFDLLVQAGTPEFKAVSRAVK
jgi:nicotinamidase-related amidase